MFKTICLKLAPTALFGTAAVACVICGSPLVAVLALVAAVGSFVIA